MLVFWRRQWADYIYLYLYIWMGIDVHTNVLVQEFCTMSRELGCRLCLWVTTSPWCEERWKLILVVLEKTFCWKEKSAFQTSSEPIPVLPKCNAVVLALCLINIIELFAEPSVSLCSRFSSFYQLLGTFSYTWLFGSVRALAGFPARVNFSSELTERSNSKQAPRELRKPWGTMFSLAWGCF